jgi:hypothetical protein
MPLTAKGTEIESSMKKEYGAKKGEEVFYASKNKGTISGVDSQKTTKKYEVVVNGRMWALCSTEASAKDAKAIKEKEDPTAVVTIRTGNYITDSTHMVSEFGIRHAEKLDAICDAAEALRKRFDSSDPAFDLRTRKLAAAKGVRVTGRVGGYEPYNEVAATHRTVTRWLREKREETKKR